MAVNMADTAGDGGTKSTALVAAMIVPVTGVVEVAPQLPRPWLVPPATRCSKSSSRRVPDKRVKQEPRLMGWLWYGAASRREASVEPVVER